VTQNGDGHLRILVVDDDEVDRKAVMRALKASSLAAKVSEASDVATARLLVNEQEFDCLLVDYYLPGGDGTDVIRAVAGTKSAAPVIVLTGRGDEQLAVELMKGGAADYLTKGAQMASALAPSIRRAVRVAQAERAASVARDQLAAQARQLAGLAAANLRVQAALSVTEALDVSAAEARTLLAAGAAVARLEVPGDGPTAHESLAPKFGSLDEVRSAGVPWLEAPLLTQDGARLGSLAVADPLGGTFRLGDEPILMQLAQSVAIAIEKARLFKASQDASRMRDDVLAIVSHDLRSPLNTISMSAGLLREDVGPREVALVERIERGVVRMNRLISDLLDASCIDEGKLSVNPRPEQASAIVREAVDSAVPLAGARGCAVRCGPLDDSLLVSADRHRLLQVFANLLGNAIKFSPKGGVVAVDVAHDGPVLTFSVSDQGPGIAPEHTDRLFDRYYKANAASREGAGLGLFIARGIVLAHGGKIRVESERGNGTRMIFSLLVATR
jgi:signal transduction histidine kinase